eukprot:TRINITY_DN3034_c2_g1_i1.p1 TRINITY_DN3034_c2_g1~~TRINITY_DN3034_c2_g1_i1.p1  ORF type:complete len:573 (-),score=118.24 TRINITY_DN3034_c2_g1_i1:920-2545(-)
MHVLECLPAPVLWPACAFLDADDIVQLSAVSPSLHQGLSSAAADGQIWSRRTRSLAASYDVSLFSTLACWDTPSTWMGLTTFRELYFWARRVLPLLGLWRWDKGMHGGVLVLRAQGGVVLASLIRPIHEPHFYTSAAVHFTSRTIFRLLPKQRLPLPSGKSGTFVAASMVEVPGKGTDDNRLCEVVSAIGVVQLLPSPAADATSAPHENACAERLVLAYQASCRGFSYSDGSYADGSAQAGATAPVIMPEAGREKFERLPAPCALPFLLSATCGAALAGRFGQWSAPPALVGFGHQSAAPLLGPDQSAAAAAPAAAALPPIAIAGDAPHDDAAAAAMPLVARNALIGRALPHHNQRGGVMELARSPLARHVPGLFFAIYGPHGIEMVSVRLEDGILKGLKATGDGNVPSGRLTFRSAGPLQVPPFATPPCSCGFECECFTSNELRHVTLLGKMEAQARTAQTGFINDTWNNATIVLFDARKEWMHYSTREPAVARVLESPIRAVAAPTGCASSIATCAIGLLVTWCGDGFRTSMRFRPFCP